MAAYEFPGDTPVWKLVRGHESRAAVLAQFGIDYCCGGNVPLNKACARQGVSVEQVLRALEDDDDLRSDTDQIDWTRESMTRLADHIVARHHTYLREMLPSLEQLMNEVLIKHVKQQPNLIKLCEVYRALWKELLDHMLKEEIILFPFIRAMEAAQESGGPVPAFHCGSICMPIHAMEDEHRSTAESLLCMRELTSGFVPPKDACNAYRVLMAGLCELESDLHLHIHKENNILFPRTAELETSRSAAAVL